MHWGNVVILTVLLMSGLNIFNTHPALDWGKESFHTAPPLLELDARQYGSGELVGVTRILGASSGPRECSAPPAIVSANCRRSASPPV